MPLCSINQAAEVRNLGFYPYRNYPMGKRFTEIAPASREFIDQQKIFFVATAASEGRVNLSPKGMDTLRVLNENRVIWLNLTGSGNETAAHLRENNRITLMFCAFEGKPNILRLYGTARVYYPQDEQWQALISYFPAYAGARQIIDVAVDLVQSSCGFAVPFMEYQGEREDLRHWADRKSEADIKQYWAQKNKISLDGKPTGL